MAGKRIDRTLYQAFFSPFPQSIQGKDQCSRCVYSGLFGGLRYDGATVVVDDFVSGSIGLWGIGAEKWKLILGEILSSFLQILLSHVVV